MLRVANLDCSTSVSSLFLSTCQGMSSCPFFPWQLMQESLCALALEKWRMLNKYAGGTTRTAIQQSLYSMAYVDRMVGYRHRVAVTFFVILPIYDGGWAA